MTIKEEFKSELESLHKSLIEVNDWMYENPELAFEEFETSKYLVNYIKNMILKSHIQLMVLIQLLK